MKNKLHKLCLLIFIIVFLIGAAYFTLGLIGFRKESIVIYNQSDDTITVRIEVSHAGSKVPVVDKTPVMHQVMSKQIKKAEFILDADEDCSAILIGRSIDNVAQRFPCSDKILFNP